MCYWYLWILGAFIVYKLIDWLLRIPRVRDLNTRYILVTGCGRGLGLEAAIRLDKIGCHVFAGCRREESETELRKKCSSRLKTVHLDVASPHSVKKALDFVTANLPPGKGLWAIINNAAIVGSYSGPLPWLQRSDYDEVLNVNLHGAVAVTMTFLPLVKKERGRIINISSLTAMIPNHYIGPIYSISKCGLEAFSDILRREMIPFGVDVNIIELAAFKTDLLNEKAMAAPIEAAFSRCSPDLKDEYGISFPENIKKRCIQKMLKTIPIGNISEAIDVYEQATLGMFPRSRYVTVDTMGCLYRLHRWLPEWLIDRAIPIALSITPESCRN